MHAKHKWVSVALTLVLVIAAGLWWAIEGSRTSSGAFLASGVIEATEVLIASEVPARVVEVAAEEGQTVEAGAVLARLDDAVARAQVRQAATALELAQAQQARLLAGARPQELRQAMAAVGQAQAARNAARQAVEDSLSVLKDPQELKARITAARARVAAAEQRVQAALQAKEAAQRQRVALETALDALRKRVTVPNELQSRLSLAVAQEWSAWVSVNASQATLEGAKDELGALLAMQQDPLAMQAQMDAARARYEAAEAALALAQARLEALQNGATAEQRAGAEAQVRQAQAGLRAAQLVHDKLTLRAPRAGLIQARTVSLGELALPGATLLRLADLNQVTMSIYVPEGELGRVRLGQEVMVVADAYPGRNFPGKVSFIAPQAEFTPKSIQTRDQRARTVYAVKMVLDNPDGALKPGMWGEARL
ncbi:MAG: efflux RND transporter periplasmic adaptor subunit [Chloroflexota bacterium]